MNDTLWAVAKDMRNEVSNRIEHRPLPEYANSVERPAPPAARRWIAAALVAGALVIFHALVG